MTTALVVDSHPLFRKALAGLIDEMGAFTRVLSAVNATEGLQLAANHNLGLVLLDPEDAAGVEAIGLYRQASSALILVVTALDDPDLLSAAIAAGAAAIVPKRVSMDTLTRILRRALAGLPLHESLTAVDISAQTVKVTGANTASISVRRKV